MILSRRVITIGFIVVLLIILISLSRSFYQTVSLIVNQNKINKEILQLKEEQDSLTNSLEEKESNEYVEKAARDKLLMIKPEEKMVILPQNSNQESSISKAESGLNSSALTNLPNPQKWLRLLFPR